jgi:branched-chain amino acid transport system permease protein
MGDSWKYPAFWIVTGLVVASGLVVLVSDNPTWRENAFLILMSVAMASSLNILLGYTGYVSFGHIVFFGIGGYVGFYLISEQGWSLWIAMVAGGIAAGVLALLLGLAILRLRGAYFALATIGVNEAVRTFVNNFEPFGGPTGMEFNFAVYKDYGGIANVPILAFWAIFTLTLVVLIASYIIKFSRFGLGLMAIREDEDAAMTMGIRTPWFKTMAYVASAIVPGMIGVIFFFKNSSIAPQEAFRLHRSIEMLVIVMLGGFGTVIGPLGGAAIYETMRTVLLTNDYVKDLQLAIAGVLLLIIILFVPSGLAGWLRRQFPALRRIIE